jgi:hypothetical protein
VEIVATGEPASTAALEEVIRELLDRLPVQLEWTIASAIDPRDVLERREVEEDVVARVWIDLSDAERARIYVANAGSDRFLVRFVPLEHGYDEVARESLGHIIESSVDALLAGGEIGVSREAAEVEVAEAMPDRTPPPRPIEAPVVRTATDRAEGARVSIGAAYQASALASDPLFLHGPAIFVAVGVPRGWNVRPLAWVGAQWVLPYDWSRISIGARFEGGGARAALGFETRVDPLVLFRGMIGIGIDLAWVTPWAQEPARARPAFLFAAPIAILGANFEIAIAGPLALAFGLSLEADLAGNHFDLQSDDGTSTAVLAPWPVRPALWLGLAFAIDDDRQSQ